jgi:hypothetical protein
LFWSILHAGDALYNISAALVIINILNFKIQLVLLQILSESYVILLES